ncbi:NADH-quinone oxidoreductase subunit H [candidate division KSB1 bacterium]|nr:NADH-quinone oxidoreductase subunit H [candidate division KSB1 bacterium]
MIGLKLLLLLGFMLGTAVFGLIVGWVDRKVSARVQFRVGPPLLQNFNDFFKLMGKETILVKEGIHWLFIAAPLAAFSMLAVISTMIWVALILNQGFGGDLIVVMYLMMIYSVMIVIGGSSTGNVYSSIGAGREIKLLLGDELVFILVCLVPIIQTNYALQLDQIIAKQAENGMVIGSVSGTIAFILGLLCIQAKIAMPPFHIAEAETELVEGPLMEYSGPLLAFWKLNHHMMIVAYPLLLVLLFFGGFNLQGIGILWAVLKYLVIVVLMILIKNTNPRIRIDTALHFFWRIAAPLGLIAVILAVLGV